MSSDPLPDFGFNAGCSEISNHCVFKPYFSCREIPSSNYCEEQGVGRASGIPISSDEQEAKKTKLEPDDFVAPVGMLFDKHSIFGFLHKVLKEGDLLTRINDARVATEEGYKRIREFDFNTALLEVRFIRNGIVRVEQIKNPLSK